ncbi:MAG TPA: prolyl aminopeptidase [Chromatiales bacterium]|nr:prolyl aminopeptidase [Thiotrichales bacterium]HIP68125.1 prolyl aminopeptidase [Chromatiales bacterium]
MYPEILPYKVEHLPVSDGHQLYLEQSGNSQGLPVLFLHGGPGGGCQPWNRQFFDPKRYRIILFDQRGAGKSTPHASLHANTTQHLVADIETIREHLGIDRWLIFGGSWGSTLALAYAEQHPEHVMGLILRGIFLCRDEDIHWFYQHGAGRLFPDYWLDFLAPIPEHERYDLVSAYYKRLTGNDEVARMACAEAWSVWEGRTATLNADARLAAHFAEPYFALAMARIECHYFMNHAFIKPNQLLEDAHKLANIPGVIVHGRYDIICPVDQAFLLHQEWPDSELNVIPAAGHAASEPGIAAALVQATDKMAESFA